MSQRKKLSDYRNDSSLVFPTLAWIANKTMIPVIIILTVITVVATSIYYKIGVQSAAEILKEPQSTSPYLSIQAVQSVGNKWASDAINIKPINVSTWNVDGTMKPQHINDPQNCLAETKLPTSLLTTQTASGDNVSTKIQVYGAGQAITQYKEYIKLLSKCVKGNDQNIQNIGNVFVYDNNFILTMGDSIISVTAPDNARRDELQNFYQDQLSQSLLASGCVTLNIPENSATRSFYYNKDTYTGLLETQTLNNQVNVDNVPVMTSVNMNAVSEPNAKEPEAPLPADFPVISEKVNQPTLPKAVEDETGFSKDASYQIMDPIGPGCGWAWSSQEAPVFNETSLKNKENETLDNVQVDVNNQAQMYVDQKVAWAEQTADIAPAVDSWNKYVINVNSVHDKWNWLNSERAKIKNSWMSYVEEHDDWFTFDDRKAKATNDYSTKLQQCLDAQTALQNWENQWGALYEQQQSGTVNPTPTTSPSPNADPSVTPDPNTPTEAPTTSAPSPSPNVSIPPRPAGCSTLPAKDSIIEQEKPAEPQAPLIPQGVTIPSSWPTPQK